MKILFVDGCVRGKEISRTYRLCDYYLNLLKEKYKDAEISTVCLDQEKVTPITREELERRDDLAREGKYDDPGFQYARDFAGADMIVVGAPYWDLSFPAVLKAYVERICVGGITFKYEGTDCVGLCKAARMVCISTMGGYIDNTHMGEDYLEAICSMLGIKGFETCCAEGLDIYGEDVEGKMEQAMEWLRDMV